MDVIIFYGKNTVSIASIDETYYFQSSSLFEILCALQDLKANIVEVRYAGIIKTQKIIPMMTIESAMLDYKTIQ